MSKTKTFTITNKLLCEAGACSAAREALAPFLPITITDDVNKNIKALSVLPATELYAVSNATAAYWLSILFDGGCLCHDYKEGDWSSAFEDETAGYDIGALAALAAELVWENVEPKCQVAK